MKKSRGEGIKYFHGTTLVRKNPRSAASINAHLCNGRSPFRPTCDLSAECSEVIYYRREVLPYTKRQLSEKSETVLLLIIAFNNI